MAALGRAYNSQGAVTCDTLQCQGVGNFDGDLTVATNKFTVAAASGNGNFAGTLNCAGAFSVATNKFTCSAAGAVAIASTCNVVGNLSVATNKFVVTATNGNTSVAGTLDATGDFKVNTDKLVVTAASGNVASAGSILSTSATGGIGYGTGAGGAATQGTNRTTGVTVSKLCGAITTHNASLAAAAYATFTVTNTAVAALDTVIVSLKTPSSTGFSVPWVTEVADGSFKITMHNIHATTADTSASVINFAVIKAVAS